MKRILIILILLSPFFIHAQVKIYKSYQDYKKNFGKTYDTYKGYKHSMGNVTLVLFNKGKKAKVACKDIWGFKYKNALFRIDKVHNQPTHVVSQGKMVLYDNGMANLSMIKNGTEMGQFSIGYYYYISKSISSEIVPVPSFIDSYAKKKIKKFKEQNPQYKTFFDCIGKRFSLMKVPECVKAFEKG